MDGLAVDIIQFGFLQRKGFGQSLFQIDMKFTEDDRRGSVIGFPKTVDRAGAAGVHKAAGKAYHPFVPDELAFPTLTGAKDHQFRRIRSRL